MTGISVILGAPGKIIKTDQSPSKNKAAKSDLKTEIENKETASGDKTIIAGGLTYLIRYNNNKPIEVIVPFEEYRFEMSCCGPSSFISQNQFVITADEDHIERVSPYSPLLLKPLTIETEGDSIGKINSIEARAISIMRGRIRGADPKNAEILIKVMDALHRVADDGKIEAEKADQEYSRPPILTSLKPIYYHKPNKTRK